MNTYDYIDGPVSTAFTHPMSVSPEDAEVILSSAIEAIGGTVITGFDPTQQNRRADEGYVSADLRIEFPDGRRMWVSVECPTDEAN